MSDLPLVAASVVPLVAGTIAAVSAFLVGVAWAGPRAYRNGRAQGHRDIINRAASPRPTLHLVEAPTSIHDQRADAMRRHPSGLGLRQW